MRTGLVAVYRYYISFMFVNGQEFHGFDWLIHLPFLPYHLGSYCIEIFFSLFDAVSLRIISMTVSQHSEMKMRLIEF